MNTTLSILAACSVEFHRGRSSNKKSMSRSLRAFLMFLQLQQVAHASLPLLCAIQFWLHQEELLSYGRSASMTIRCCCFTRFRGGSYHSNRFSIMSIMFYMSLSIVTDVVRLHFLHQAAPNAYLFFTSFCPGIVGEHLGIAHEPNICSSTLLFS
ncbi:hypothetical protein GOP47_0029842 [Adiantum capillus-veneris]|nr:hypothetical protein GOP47_0029842 [Adiantum capillus-veneris]